MHKKTFGNNVRVEERRKKKRNSVRVNVYYSLVNDTISREKYPLFFLLLSFFFKVFERRGDKKFRKLGSDVYDNGFDSKSPRDI